MVHGALGSDTGGSIRCPAAVAGIVGILPTYGRVSRRGALPMSFSLDSVGPLARTARDCARLLGVIAGHDPQDASSFDVPVPDYETALDSDHYSRRRDELWFRGRAWLARDDAILPDDQALIGELTATRYTYTSAARIEVDSKAELKRGGLPSPDLADAFLLTFAVADTRRTKGSRGRRRRQYPYRPPLPKRSWMQA